MKTVTSLFTAMLVVAAFSGCASVSQMPLSSNSDRLDISDSKSLVVARVHVVNENRPSQQPDLCCIFLKRNDKLRSYTRPIIDQNQGQQGKSYFVSMDVEPGITSVEFGRFVRSVPMLIQASADLPMKVDIDVPPNSVVYLGNINVTIVPRKDGEPAAGSMLPLIDQSVAGFSNGAFRVEIQDRYDEDMAAFRQRFPALATHTVANAVLSPWIHPDQRDALLAKVEAAEPLEEEIAIGDAAELPVIDPVLDDVEASAVQ